MKRAKEITITLQGIDEIGICSYFSIKINEDYTMRQLVNAVRSRGFVKFRILDTMKVFVDAN